MATFPGPNGEHMDWCSQRAKHWETQPWGQQVAQEYRRARWEAWDAQQTVDTAQRTRGRRRR